MRAPATMKILGILLMMFSICLLPPLFVDLIYKENASIPFLSTMLLSIFIGLILYVPFYNRSVELKVQDGFLIVVLFWTVLSFMGAMPLILAHHPQLSFVDAVFESVSGLTTTGATVIPYLDDLPRSVLFYRQQLQFMGGLGIIILAVAILPMLGIGGMQLYKAEMTGPMKDTKLTPRITETAKAIWSIYILMAVSCAFLYWLFGMNAFDSICMSFSTVATGGYATHSSSFAYFQDPMIKITCITFMILGAISFPMHYRAITTRSISGYKSDEEVRTFFRYLIYGVFFVLVTLGIKGRVHDTAWLDGIFQAVSFMTTTGFTSVNHGQWPLITAFGLLLMGIIGGCAGSTTAGLKVVRVDLLQKHGIREIFRLIHPQGTFTVKLGNSIIPTRVNQAIFGFFALYIVSFSAILIAVLFFEPDFFTAYTATIATFGNIGPGLGNVVSDYSSLQTGTKWILSAAMLAGRLEIFTIIVLLMPAFWRG